MHEESEKKISRKQADRIKDSTSMWSDILARLPELDYRDISRGLPSSYRIEFDPGYYPPPPCIREKFLPSNFFSEQVKLANALIPITQALIKAFPNDTQENVENDPPDIKPEPTNNTAVNEVNANFQDTYNPQPFQNKGGISTALFDKLANYLVEIVNHCNLKDFRKQKRYTNFMNHVANYNGVFCTPLDKNDCQILTRIIASSLKKSSLEENNTWESVTRTTLLFINEFRIFCIDRFHFTTSKYIKGNRDVSKYIQFDNNINRLIQEIKSDVACASSHSTFCHPLVAATMTYQQYKIINSLPQTNEDRHSRIACLFRPTTGKIRYAISDNNPLNHQKIEVVFVLLDIRGNRINGMYALDKLADNSDLKQTAIQLFDPINKLLEKPLLNKDRNRFIESTLTLKPESLNELIQRIEQLFNEDIEGLIQFRILESTKKNINTNQPTKKNKKQGQKTAKTKSILSLSLNRLPVFRSLGPKSFLTKERSSLNLRGTHVCTKDQALILSQTQKRILPIVKHDTTDKIAENQQQIEYGEMPNNNLHDPDETVAQFDNVLEYLSKVAIDTHQSLHKQCEDLDNKKSLALSEIRNIDRFTVNTDDDSETSQLIELPGARLLPYQLHGAVQLLAAHRQNHGMLLGFDMGLGKTIILGKLIRYFNARNSTPILVVVPRSVLIKWKLELETKCDLLDKVLKYHGIEKKYRNNALMSAFSNNKVVLTTHETYRNNLFQRNSLFAKSCGIIDVELLVKVKESSLQKWPEVLKLIGREKDLRLLKRKLFKRNETKYFRNVLTKLPSDKCLTFLKQKLNISHHDLGKLFAGHIILEHLEEKGILRSPSELLFSNKRKQKWQGRYVMDGNLIQQTSLNNLYERNQELAQYISREDAENKLKAIKTFSSLVIDEGHRFSNPASSLFKCALTTMFHLQKSNGFRSILTGTPYQNNIKELWALYHLLNPGSVLKQYHIEGFYFLLFDKAGEMIKRITAQDTISEQVIEGYKDTLQNILHDFLDLANRLSSRCLRKSKSDIDVITQFTELDSTNLGKAPKTQESILSWNCTEEQTNNVMKIDSNSIESACRNQAMLSSKNSQLLESKDRLPIIDISGLKMSSMQLFRWLVKNNTHPALVNIKNKSLFKVSSKTLSNIEQQIEQIIHDEGGIESFIKQSGKLSLVSSKVKEIIQQKDSKLLISVCFRAHALILKKIFEEQHADKNLKVLIYSGDLKNDKERDLTIKAFNRQFDCDDNQRMILICLQKSGGEGIQLNATHVMLYDLPWSDSASEQMIGRANRPTNAAKFLHVLKLVGNNPIDQKFLAFIQFKSEMTKFLVNRDPNCDLIWFVDIVKSYLETMLGLSALKIDQDKLNALSEQLKHSIKADQLEYLECNQHEQVTPDKPSHEELFFSPKSPSRKRKAIASPNTEKVSPAKKPFSDSTQNLLMQLSPYTVKSSSQNNLFPEDTHMAVMESFTEDQDFFTPEDGNEKEETPLKRKHEAVVGRENNEISITYTNKRPATIQKEKPDDDSNEIAQIFALDF